MPQPFRTLIQWHIGDLVHCALSTSVFSIIFSASSFVSFSSTSSFTCRTTLRGSSSRHTTRYCALDCSDVQLLGRCAQVRHLLGQRRRLLELLLRYLVKYLREYILKGAKGTRLRQIATTTIKGKPIALLAQRKEEQYTHALLKPTNPSESARKETQHKDHGDYIAEGVVTSSVAPVCRLTMVMTSAERPLHGKTRHEGARSRRERRRRAEARLRLMLLRDAQLLASYRGGPVLAEAVSAPKLQSASLEAVLSPCGSLGLQSCPHSCNRVP